MDFGVVNNDAVKNFQEWVLGQGSEQLYRANEEPYCVADFIHDWIWSGKGVRACHGSFEVYLTAVILIINAWTLPSPSDGNSLSFDYLEDVGDEGVTVTHERIASVVFREGSASDIILDRNFFERCVYREHHGSQGMF